MRLLRFTGVRHQTAVYINDDARLLGVTKRRERRLHGRRDGKLQQLSVTGRYVMPHHRPFHK